MGTFQKVVLDEFDEDSLDGKPLKAGERVIVRWGDGSTTTHAVAVDSGGESLVTVQYRGTSLTVFLLESGLSLVRDE